MTQEQSVRIPLDGDQEDLPARLWLPEAGHGPGLLLIQEIFGVSGYIKSRARDLAALGYVVLAPQLFFRFGVDAIEPDEDDGSGQNVLERAMGVAGQVDWEQTVGDAVSALAALRRRPEVSGGTGVIGFCFGGGLAFNVAAVAEPDVLVSYYGSALPNLLDLAPRVSAPSLHHFGLADSYLPPDVVERISTAIRRPGVQIETYPGAEHAFDGPMPGLHHPAAAEQAWATTTRFLSAQLPIDS